MRRVAGIVVVMVGLVCASQPAWAARTRFHDAAESAVYKEKMGGMIGRGLLNVVTSFVDVLVNIVNGTKDGPPLIGTLTGLGKGAGCGVLRLGSGAVDITTFWVPGFNGFPVSDSYDDCLKDSQGMASYEEPEPEYAASAIEFEAMIEPAIEPVETIAQAPKPIEVSQPKKVWKK